MVSDAANVFNAKAIVCRGNKFFSTLCAHPRFESEAYGLAFRQIIDVAFLPFSMIFKTTSAKTPSLVAREVNLFYLAWIVLYGVQCSSANGPTDAETGSFRTHHDTKSAPAFQVHEQEPDLGT